MFEKFEIKPQIKFYNGKTQLQKEDFIEGEKITLIYLENGIKQKKTLSFSDALLQQIDECLKSEEIKYPVVFKS